MRRLRSFPNRFREAWNARRTKRSSCYELLLATLPTAPRLIQQCKARNAFSFDSYEELVSAANVRTHSTTV